MRPAAHLVGETTASRVKTLAIWIERTDGPAAADAFVRSAGIDPAYLADETRPLSVAQWHRALVEFVARHGRGAIARTSAASVDPRNLGVWTRVLRGADGPEAALGQLDEVGGDRPASSRWETIEARPGRWRGRAVVSHDPALEEDGLLAAARAAELGAVPLLYGLGAVSSRRADAGSPSPAAATAQEFEVSWRAGRADAAFWLVLAGALAVVWALMSLWPAARLGSIAAIALGSSAAVYVALEARRRSALTAQDMRIRALERSVRLKEDRERSQVGWFEGSVVAGRYRLGPKLGAGASGAIFRALRLDDGADVAIKLLRAGVAHDSRASDRLRREAEALGLAWHPNVVEVLDHDHLPDGTSYLVMEYLRGESLASRLRTRGTLRPDELLSVALQVCDALGAVHAAGVIHRDVKPANLYLVPPPAGAEGAAERVKMLDFGVAHVEWAETRLTGEGGPLGTPGYMSPEQEHGGAVDARSDVFGVGAVLFECLTGSPPPTATASGVWHAGVGAAAESAVEASRSPALDRAIDSLPDGWRAVIERALQPVARDRYPTARALREALEALGTLTGTGDDAKGA